MTTAPDREIFEKAKSLRSEYVVMAKGVIRERKSKNPALPTGNIELYVNDLRVLSAAETTPFEIRDEVPVREDLALTYRYLELRKPSLTNNLITRHRIVKCARDYFDSQNFLEIETPMLCRSTPEGARDYLVPSRGAAGQVLLPAPVPPAVQAAADDSRYGPLHADRKVFQGRGPPGRPAAGVHPDRP